MIFIFVIYFSCHISLLRNYLGHKRLWLLVRPLANGAYGRTKVKCDCSHGPGHKAVSGSVAGATFTESAICLYKTNLLAHDLYRVSQPTTWIPKLRKSTFVGAFLLHYYYWRGIWLGDLLLCHLADVLSSFPVLSLSNCDSRLMLLS